MPQSTLNVPLLPQAHALSPLSPASPLRAAAQVSFQLDNFRPHTPRRFSYLLCSVLRPSLRGSSGTSPGALTTPRPSILRAPMLSVSCHDSALPTFYIICDTYRAPVTAHSLPLSFHTQVTKQRDPPHRVEMGIICLLEGLMTVPWA